MTKSSITVKKSFGRLLQSLLLTLMLLVGTAPQLEAQTVTLPSTKVTVQQTISTIRKQAKMSVDFQQRALNLTEVLTFSTKEQTIPSLMNAIIGSKNLEYSINGRHIIISPKGAQAQQATTATGGG